MRTYFIRVPKWARNIYPKAIWNAPRGRINWTFDDGPHPKSTPLLLELLEKKKINATFFMNGRSCLEYPALVKEVRSAGHIIGSHGFDHLDGWRTSTDVYIEDVAKSLEILQSNLFRPPYGRMTIKQYKRVSEMCDIMMWSIMPGDFEKNLSRQVLLKRMKMIVEEDIVVLHDTPCAVQRSIPMLIEDHGINDHWFGR